MASMFFWFQIFSCFFVLLPLGSLGFTCTGPYYPPQGFSYAHIESNASGRASQDYAKIRIKVIYDSTIENKPYKGLVQEAVKFWSEALSVKPVDGRIFKRRDCESETKTTYKDLDGSRQMKKYCLGSCNKVTKCIDVEIPNEYLDGCMSCNENGQDCRKNTDEIGTGIENADLVFYVSAISTESCDKFKPVAYAGPCDLDPVTDRPVFAMINICPRLAESHIKDDKTMLLTIKHEMMHPLGFLYYLFGFFRDKEGTKLWPRDEKGQPKTEGNEEQHVIGLIEREWHVHGDVIPRKLHLLITPNVKREAQTYFGCDDLEGAELEDFGEEGSRWSHFEARVFHDDAMKANLDTGKGLFSRLDFAVLDDSGWYEVDYDQAENMEYGRNLGCDFCKKSCKFWMKTKKAEGKSVDPYCETPDFMKREHFSCSGAKKFFSGCPLAQFDSNAVQIFHEKGSLDSRYELPVKYQNFDEISGVRSIDVTLYGSVDTFPDFCPIPMKNWDITAIKNVADKVDCDEETEDEEDESNESSSLGCSLWLVSLFAWMAIML